MVRCLSCCQLTSVSKGHTYIQACMQLSHTTAPTYLPTYIPGVWIKFDNVFLFPFFQEQLDALVNSQWY